MKSLKIVIARHDDKAYNDYLKPSLDFLSARNVNPSDPAHGLIWKCEVTNEPNDSIFKKYNRGIEILGVQDDDVFCFIHEDVRILDAKFFEKVKMVFESDQKIGVLGLIGTTSFPEQGGWWLTDHSNHFGHLIQGLPDGTSYHMNRGTGFKKNMVSVDGFCFMMNGKFLKTYRFDEMTYPDAYHFYDVDSCLSSLMQGYSVAVADILMEHKSEGPMPLSWHKSKESFLAKWKEKGLTFPVTYSQFVPNQ